MFNQVIVHEALKHSWPHDGTAKNQDSLISLLIHDVFGGEILKTPDEKGWHFYNRVNGKRIDFTSSESGNNSKNGHFKDIPATPEETCTSFEQVDYSTYLMRFIRTFEEAVGLKRLKTENNLNLI
jgi:hypothetical protein